MISPVESVYVAPYMSVDVEDGPDNGADDWTTNRSDCSTNACSWEMQWRM